MKILLAAGNPAVYGSGHASRMLILKSELINMGNNAVLCDTADILAQTDNFDVLVWDARDDLPESDFPAKRVILVDNRSQPLSSHWEKINITPMLHHDAYAFRSAMSMVLLPDDVRPFNRVNSSRIFWHLQDPGIGIRQLAYGPRKPASQFRADLRRLRMASLYYGQSFLEALYMGCQIHLYPVSEYHRKLSLFFLHNWTGTRDKVRLFDGAGASRVARYICGGVP